MQLEWREDRISAIDRAKRAMLRRLEGIEAAARAQWERSKANAESTQIEQEVIEQLAPDGTVKRVPTGKAMVKKATKGRCADDRYLQTLRGIESDRRALLGLDAPKRTELSGVGGQPLIPLEAVRLAVARVTKAEET